MRRYLVYIISIFHIIAILNSQVRPYSNPALFNNLNINTEELVYADRKINIDIKKELSYIPIILPKNIHYKFIFEIESMSQNDYIYIINNHNYNDFVGPYTYLDINKGAIISDVMKTDAILIEFFNNDIKENKHITLNLEPLKRVNTINNNKEQDYFKYRDEPVIILTGYWPPTNEMVRHFSQNNELNPNGWQGDNWENSGYDIISYFPEFTTPDCSNCGQGFGDLEVDYQDTSEDFWPIFDNQSPIAVITFSRGYMNQSWELEYNAYNRTNWINDFTSPFLPTPNPPDLNEDAFYLRNSNLPMNEIIESITSLDIGLDPYIDGNGDPGHYVSEFMAYHGTWYRDLNQFGDDNCYVAGHIHVGGYVDWDIAKIATEETIRTVIDYLNQFIYIPGDLNQDEIVDILDLVIVINSILGNIELTTLQNYASDMNEDSVINIQDIIIIINIIINNI